MVKPNQAVYGSEIWLYNHLLSMKAYETCHQNVASLDLMIT